MTNGDNFYLDTLRTWHQITLPSKGIGSGGEGRVYPISDDKAVKKYLAGYLTESKKEELLDKVTIMAFHFQEFATLRDKPFAWPLGPVIETKSSLASLQQQRKLGFEVSEFCGFVMPRVRNPIYLEDVIVEQRAGSRTITGGDRIRITRRVAEAVQLCHDAQFVIGDINTRNILVSADTLLPTLIDCDSFQFRRFTSGVGLPDFASAELLQRVDQNDGKFEGLLRRPEDDCHALAVLTFMMLMNGRHPFDYKDAPPHVNARRSAVQEHNFPYVAHGRSAPPTAEEADRYARFPGDLKTLFELAFLHGKPAKAEAWIDPLNRFADDPGSRHVAPRPRAVDVPPPRPPVEKDYRWVVIAGVIIAVIVLILIVYASGGR